MIEINEETHYTGTEAADRVGVSYTTFSKLVEDYQIPWTVGDNGARLYKQADLDKIPPA